MIKSIITIGFWCYLGRPKSEMLIPKIIGNIFTKVNYRARFNGGEIPQEARPPTLNL
jgi:hypothetical protein